MRSSTQMGLDEARGYRRENQDGGDVIQDDMLIHVFYRSQIGYERQWTSIRKLSPRSWRFQVRIIRMMLRRIVL